MTWKRPERADLAGVLSVASREVLVCSPFITAAGVRLMSDALAGKDLIRLEVWTRLDARAYLSGAHDPDALLDFLQQIQSSTSVSLRVSDRLHSKLFLSDDTQALVGSANLTLPGFSTNLELVKVVSPPEIDELLRYVTRTRALLTPITLDDLQVFVTRCSNIAKDREALLDLVREVAPTPPPSQGRLSPLSEFIRYCEQYTGETADNIGIIYYNLDGNNRTGHLKQAYYSVQRFLQEYPQHVAYLSALPAEAPFDLRGMPLELDWAQFLSTFAMEHDDSLGYDISILLHYLTRQYGGIVTGGGGGDYPFKLVWPLVARMMAEHP